ncbi:MAG: GNAT family N-acetyltransferase [Clostridia bacterium]|nr:GNAT family N-acetyltransferase [Clostridia bacterium]
MIDRSISYYNLILKCNDICTTPVSLSEVYNFKMYDAGDEKYWAKLEYEIGDFLSIEEAEMYFKANYCNQIDELEKRCVFVVDDKGNVVGSCIAWHDLKGNNTVASLHWLVVSPKYQGKHIGLVLCKKVMDIFNERGETPIYIHTQPWSYKAILLYIKLGFKIQKTDTFSHYENQYEQAIKTLENILTEKQILILNQNTE